MYILLIIWILFVIAYLGFNLYGLTRVQAMRIKGDIVPLAILVYLIVIFVIIAVSILLILNLDWGKNLRELFRI